MNSLEELPAKILLLIAQGKTIPQIAKLLTLKLSTVKNQIRYHVLGVLKTNNRSRAVAIAVREGLIPCEKPKRPLREQLTDREWRALQMIADGATDHTIARRLTSGATKSAGSAVVRRLMDKLYARNREHLVYCGFQYGLLS